MAFEPYVPSGARSAHRRGPAKITVLSGANGRTQLTLSASARDHLLLPEEQAKADASASAPQMHDPAAQRQREQDERQLDQSRRIAVLVDRESGRVRLRLVYEEAPNAYRPNGLRQGQTCYLSVQALGEELGMPDGSGLVELMEPGTIEFSVSGVVPRERAKKEDRVSAQEEQIRQVLDEGLTTVNGRAVER